MLVIAGALSGLVAYASKKNDNTRTYTPELVGVGALTYISEFVRIAANTHTGSYTPYAPFIVIGGPAIRTGIAMWLGNTTGNILYDCMK
jgi:hypothetical protein